MIELKRKNYQSTIVVVFLLAMTVLTTLSMNASGGRLIYTLDDPYIHLAVAENILRGGYGVNLSEFSSPSSSILYPFLLTIPVFFGFATWGPLIIGVLSSCLTLWVLSGFVWDAIIETKDSAKGWFFFFTPPLLLLSLNSIALPMTGMEHPLHVLASVLVIAGLVEMVRRESVPVMLISGVLLCAVVRFEGLALALAAIAAMIWQRHSLVAAAMLLGGGFVIVGHAVAMNKIGLPVLPSSVLVKSGVSAAAIDASFISALKHVIQNISYSLHNRWGTIFSLTILALCIALARPRLECSVKVVGIVSMAALAAHIAFGRYGWFSRYEIYAVAIVIMAILHVYSKYLTKGVSPRMSVILITFGLAILGSVYTGTTLSTPAAARNIYEQQFQMHRFATNYFPHPVAVNDLGWVAFRNDAYVLDLVGLGSEEARRLTRSGGRTAMLVERMAKEHDVTYAMIYDSWFRNAVPIAWCRIANLKTSKVTAASSQVSFYLIDQAARQEMYRALEDFSPTLPTGASLEIFNCGAE